MSLANILNEHLAGLKAGEITFDKIQDIQKDIENRLSLHPKVLIDIIHFVYETITDSGETEIYVNNAKSILKYPEYNDDDKENLKKLVASSDADGIEAKIGKENDFEILQDCSLVTINYSLGNKKAGKIGVIGPKRMNYSKVFASLDLISNEIDKILNEYISDE